MHKYLEYFEKIVGNETKEKELKNIVSETMEKIRRHCPEEFYCAMYKVHCLAYGPHFDEELAKKAVSAMRNVDGTTGEHWSMEKTNPLAEQNGIKEKADFYYTMNMLYSDFSDVLGSEESTYVKMAKAYMHDPDAPEGKVFDIWLAQMKREDK